MLEIGGGGRGGGQIHMSGKGIMHANPAKKGRGEASVAGEFQALATGTEMREFLNRLGENNWSTTFQDDRSIVLRSPSSSKKCLVES